MRPFGLPFDDETEPTASVTPSRITSRGSASPAASASQAAQGARASAPPGSVDEPAVLPPARSRGPLTVSQLTAVIKARLEAELSTVWVEGQITNLHINNGHAYFALKDASAQVRAVLFSSNRRGLGFQLEDGQQVLARGRLSVYERRGEYQVVCDLLEPKGVGALHVAFEQLKRRLQAEGLFEKDRKRPLPTLPRAIGLVTSLEAAALRDMLKVLRRRHANARIVISPARVQGAGAAQDIARALAAIGQVPDVDVVIVGRGGGSLEDLWAFNEEAVARAIIACPVPVISAVGHETDTTIADYVSDLRAPTPSAAAELVVAAADDFTDRIARASHRLRMATRARWQQLAHRTTLARGRTAFAAFPASVALRGRDLSDLVQALRACMDDHIARRSRALAALDRTRDQHDPTRQLTSLTVRLTDTDHRLAAIVTQRVHLRDSQWRQVAAQLAALNPLAVLGRGYAVAWDGTRTRVLRRAAEVEAGDAIVLTLADGELACDVRRTLRRDA